MEAKMDNGLIQGHAYSVTDVRRVSHLLHAVSDVKQTPVSFYFFLSSLGYVCPASAVFLLLLLPLSDFEFQKLVAFGLFWQYCQCRCSIFALKWTPPLYITWTGKKLMRNELDMFDCISAFARWRWKDFEVKASRWFVCATHGVMSESGREHGVMGKKWVWNDV